MRRIVGVALGAGLLLALVVLLRRAPETASPRPAAGPSASSPLPETWTVEAPVRADPTVRAAAAVDLRGLLVELSKAIEERDDARIRVLLARLREILVPPIPDEQNAALLYQSAFAVVDVLQPTGEVRKPFYDILLGKETPTGQEMAVLREWRSKNGELLDKVMALLQEAADRPACRFPQDPERGIGGVISLQRSQIAVNLLAVDAALATVDRRPEVAADRLRAALAMSRALRSDPTTLTQMIACAIDQVALDAVRREGALASPGLSSFVDGLDPASVRAAGGRALLGDVYGAVNVYLTGKAAPAEVKDAVLRAWVESPLAAQDLASYVGGISEFTGILERPFAQVQTEFDGLLLKHGEGAPWYASLDKEESGALSGVIPALTSAEARMTLLRLSSQLEQYRVRNGSYPATLDALGIPLPRDPASGQVPSYRLEAGRYTLETAGPRPDSRRLTWQSR